MRFLNVTEFPQSWGSYYRVVLRRRVFEFLLIFVLQWVGLHLAAGEHHLSPIWFFQGVNVAFVMLRGYRILWPVLLASLMAFSNLSLGNMLVYAGLQAGLPLVLVFGVRHFFGAILPWRSSRAIFGFFLSTAVVSLLEALILASIYPHTEWRGLLFACLAAFLGIILVTPLFFVWTTYIPGQRASVAQVIKRSLSILLAILAILIGSLPSLSPLRMMSVLYLQGALLLLSFTWFLVDLPAILR